MLERLRYGWNVAATEVLNDISRKSLMSRNYEEAEKELKKSIIYGERALELSRKVEGRRNRRIAEYLREAREFIEEFSGRKLFLKGAIALLPDEWGRLTDRIGQEKPTQEELREVELSILRRSYARNPVGFKNREGFKEWIKEYESELRGRVGSYPLSLRAYMAFREDVLDFQ